MASPGETAPSAPPPPKKDTFLEDAWKKYKTAFKKARNENELDKAHDFHVQTLNIASKRKEELEKKKQELTEELEETKKLLERTKEILRAFDPVPVGNQETIPPSYVPVQTSVENWYPQARRSRS